MTVELEQQTSDEELGLVHHMKTHCPSAGDKMCHCFGQGLALLE
jgi:hypothetical protein